MAHFPPYCSKYNPIEHRFFPHVTRSCLGVPLDSVETAQHYMAKTETTTGLKTAVRLLEAIYETGRQYATDFKKTMTIVFDDFLPKWEPNRVADSRLLSGTQRPGDPDLRSGRPGESKELLRACLAVAPAEEHSMLKQYIVQAEKMLPLCN